jgi:hypothetical protein
MSTNQYGVLFPWKGRRQENPERLRRALERVADHYCRRRGLERGPVRVVVIPPSPCGCARPACIVRAGHVGAKWLATDATIGDAEIVARLGLDPNAEPFEIIDEPAG